MYFATEQAGAGMILRATKKLLSLNHIEPTPINQASLTTLNEWVVTLASATFKGKTVLAFIHAQSLLTVLTEGKSIKKNIPEFNVRLRKLLKRSNFPANLVGDMVNETNHMLIGAEINRKVSAQARSIVSFIESFCASKNSYDEIDLDVIENILFDTPHGLNKRNFYTPETWWNNYIQGEDPLNDAVKNPPPKRIIKASNKNKDGLTRDEELHMENQMLKMDLEQKIGQPFDINIAADDLPEIPLAVENQFLKHMSLFENQMRTAKEVTVYELLGKPVIKPLAAIKSLTALFKQIDRLQLLLQKHNIIIDFLGQYQPEIIYAFLADELMLKKVPNVTVPGFVSHFIYEEFHPNHELNISVKVKNFMNQVFNPEGEEDLLKWSLAEAEQLELNEQNVTSDDFIDALKTYHLTKDSTLILGFDTQVIDINPKQTEAIVAGDMVFKNEVKGRRKVKKPFKIWLRNSENDWGITRFQFDDLSV